LLEEDGTPRAGAVGLGFQIADWSVGWDPAAGYGYIGSVVLLSR
jgi:hypothetical protein